jgi:hypothetical protein
MEIIVEGESSPKHIINDPRVSFMPSINLAKWETDENLALNHSGLVRLVYRNYLTVVFEG